MEGEVKQARQLVHKTLVILDELKIYRDPRFKTLISVYEIVGKHPMYGKNTYWFFIFCEDCDKDFDDYRYTIKTIKSKNKWLRQCNELLITKFQLPNGFSKLFGSNGLNRQRAITTDS